MKNKWIITAIALPTIPLTLYFLIRRSGYFIPLEYVPYIFRENKYIPQDSHHESLTKAELFNYNKKVSDIIPQLDKTKTSILIEKSKYRLTLYHEGEPLKSYPVVFGSNPKGDKLREGDSRTPEGIFKIRDLYPHPSWSKFIWLDYPNQNSWQKHLEAKRQGKISSLDSIGGEIGIHGVPNNSDSLIDNQTNWTLGCISLKNRDVDEIYQAVSTGTIVEIIP
ncbi:MAG: L,D-transpeptidase [Prochloron sp. SP5CPC1]|nr:L,D-transpeptidase [Candidatus Paraprochloron terpiosi SP5CPC1]